MNCDKNNPHLADLIFEPELAPAGLRRHVAECSRCAAELAALESTMKLLEEWKTTEISAFFDAKLHARLRQEQAAPAPHGFAKLRAWLFPKRGPLRRQWAAGALAATLALGAGAYVVIGHEHSAPAVEASATVLDLQSFVGNQPIFQQLNALGAPDNDSGGASN